MAVPCGSGPTAASCGSGPMAASCGSGPMAVPCRAAGPAWPTWGLWLGLCLGPHPAHFSMPSGFPGLPVLCVCSVLVSAVDSAHAQLQMVTWRPVLLRVPRAFRGECLSWVGMQAGQQVCPEHLRRGHSCLHLQWGFLLLRYQPSCEYDVPSVVVLSLGPCWVQRQHR